MYVTHTRSKKAPVNIVRVRGFIYTIVKNV